MDALRVELAKKEEEIRQLNLACKYYQSEGALANWKKQCDELKKLLSQERSILRFYPRSVNDELAMKAVIITQKKLLVHYINLLEDQETKLSNFVNALSPLQTEVVELKTQNLILRERLADAVHQSTFPPAGVPNSDGSGLCIIRSASKSSCGFGSDELFGSEVDCILGSGEVSEVHHFPLSESELHHL